MPSAPEQSDRFGDDELPEALVAELRGVALRNVPAVPATLDAAILQEAKAGFARRSRFRLAARVAIGVAAAAAAVVAIALPLLHQSEREGTAIHAPVATQMLSVMPAAAAEDVDRSGKRIAFHLTHLNTKALYLDTADELGHYMEYLYVMDAPNSWLTKIPQNIPGYQMTF